MSTPSPRPGSALHRHRFGIRLVHIHDSGSAINEDVRRFARINSLAPCNLLRKITTSSLDNWTQQPAKAWPPHASPCMQPVPMYLTNLQQQGSNQWQPSCKPRTRRVRSDPPSATQSPPRTAAPLVPLPPVLIHARLAAVTHGPAPPATRH